MLGLLFRCCLLRHSFPPPVGHPLVATLYQGHTNTLGGCTIAQPPRHTNSANRSTPAFSLHRLVARLDLAQRWMSRRRADERRTAFRTRARSAHCQGRREARSSARSRARSRHVRRTVTSRIPAAWKKGQNAPIAAMASALDESGSRRYASTRRLAMDWPRKRGSTMTREMQRSSRLIHLIDCCLSRGRWPGQARSRQRPLSVGIETTRTPASSPSWVARRTRTRVAGAAAR